MSSYKKSEFVRTIGRCFVNSRGFDLYENKNGTATIRFTHPGGDLSKNLWKNFPSLEAAENVIDRIAGEDTIGAERVQKLKNAWL